MKGKRTKKRICYSYRILYLVKKTRRNKREKTKEMTRANWTIA